MSNDFRSLINIVESRDVLLENPFTRVLAALGNGKAQGQNERNKLISMMNQSWNQWIGKTGLTGTMDDMKKFLYDVVGFEPDEINQILSGNVHALPKDQTNTQDQNANLEPQQNQNNQQAQPDQSSEESQPEPQQNRGTPKKSKEIVQSFLSKASNTSDRLYELTSQFIKDPGDMEALGNISKGVDMMAEYARKIKPLDPKSANLLANEAAKYLEQIIRARVLDPVDIKKAKTKVKEIDKEFGGPNQTKESIFNFIIGSAGLLMEAPNLALSKEQVSKILDTAARFVFVNDLLGQNAPQNNANGHEGYNDEDNYKAPQGRSSRGSNNSNGVPNATVMNNLKKLGIGQMDLEHLSQLTKNRGVKLSNLEPDDSNAVRAVGWAFLRSLGY